MIPFDIPEKFIHLVESGQVVRKGALLVRVIDGIIVGHLKEVGGFNLFLPKQVPITSNPYFAGAQITSSIAQNFQLHSIQNLLATLQTTMMVGAGLSAVNLGITVAGFAIVINKLNKMDSKLDYTISQNKEIISRLKSIQEGYEFMNLAKLETAFQLIIDAERLEWSSENRRKKLHDAYMRLNDYSGYYYNFLKTKAIFEEHTMDLPSILEIYIRFFAILSGKLNIYYLQNDLINYKHAIESELERISSLPTFNKTNFTPFSS
jgi:hypothetical protein